MTWPDYPEIEVLDTVAPSLKPKRQAKWRALRTGAVYAWAEAGIVFNVTEDDPADYPVMNPGDTSDAELERVIVQPYLRLLRMDALYGGSVIGVAAWMPDTDPGSFAGFYLGDAFWRNLSPAFKRLVVTHEIGHALGLTHRSDSKTSVMYFSALGYAGSSDVPDPHDLDSLEAYYP
jgi:hypothetical protein